MTEKEIKENIIEALKDEFPNYDIKDFPINLADYNPTHPNGEILVKSLGFHPTEYITKNNQIEIINYGDFAIYHYYWRVDLICRQYKTQDEIFDLTTQIIQIFRSISNTEELGRFIVADVSEPEFDEEKQFQFRILKFIYPSTEWLGEEDE